MEDEDGKKVKTKKEEDDPPKKKRGRAKKVEKMVSQSSESDQNYWQPDVVAEPLKRTRTKKSEKSVKE